MITTNGQTIIADAGNFHTYIITTSQIWDVPSYATTLKITAIQGGAGGGGGGGASNTTGGMVGSGGQAGAVAEQFVTLNAADTQLTVTIGAGGAGGAGGTGGSSPTAGGSGSLGGATQVQGTQSGQLYAQMLSSVNVNFGGGLGGIAADATYGPITYYAFGYGNGFGGGAASSCRPGDSSNIGAPMPYGLVIGGTTQQESGGGSAQQSGQPLGTLQYGAPNSGANGGAGATATMPGCGGGGGNGGQVVNGVGGNGGAGGNGAPGMVIIEIVG